MQRVRGFTVGEGARPERCAEATPRAADVRIDAERRASQLALLQEWRSVLDRAGYRTLLSASPPMVLLVRQPKIEHRWIAISANCLLIVFERDELGGVRSDYHLLPRGTSDGVGPSARAALQAAAQYLVAG